MSFKKRASVLSLLCLGFLVAVVGLCRSIFSYVQFNNDDITWWAGPYLICSEVELAMSMICASAPALRPVLGRLWLRYQGAFTWYKSMEKKLHNWRHNRNSMSTVNDHLVTNGTDDMTNPISRMSSFSSYWRDIDMEGIAVDNNAYNVSVTAASKNWRQSVLNHTRDRQSLEYPREVLIKSMNVVAKAWPEWMTGARSPTPDTESVASSEPDHDLEKMAEMNRSMEIEVCHARPMTQIRFEMPQQPAPSFGGPGSVYSYEDPFEQPMRPRSWGLPRYMPSVTDFRNYFRHSFFGHGNASRTTINSRNPNNDTPNWI
jgi:hypothetical protein